MSKIPYVIRRGDTLYFRIRVPAKLQATIQNKEIIQTLQTQDRLEAIPIALRFASEVKIIFNNMSKDMTDIKHKRRIEALRELVRVKDVIHQDELERRELKQMSELRSVEREASLKGENKALKDVLSNSGQSLAIHNLEKKVKPTTPKLSTAMEQFASLKFDGMTKRTKEKYVTSFKMLNEFLGHEYIEGINHFKMNKVFREIEKLPPKWSRQEFKEMSIKQIIAQNKGASLHKSSFDGYRSPVSQFVEWAKEEYEGAFDGVVIRDIKYKGSRVGGEEGQRAFKPDEIDKLFRCKEMQGYCKSRNDVGKFWLPAIGLYTGMRVNEICQLNPFTDILKKDNVWCFLISAITEAAPDIEKSVKSGIERTVPIHSKLIMLGLLEYVDALKRAGYKRMFPNDTPHNNRAAGNTARNFRRYIEEIGLRDEAKDNRIVGMHAFRNNIITVASKGGFIRELMPIVGHEDKARDENGVLLPAVTKRYIDEDAMKIPLSEKKETIEKVKFDIDFYRPVKPTFKK